MKLQIKIEIALSGVYDIILDVKRKQLSIDSLYTKLCHLRNNVSLHVLNAYERLFPSVCSIYCKGKCRFKY